MTAYCWAATLICITGTVINIRRINWCFIFWAIGEVMWVIYDLSQNLWSRTMLDLLGLVLALAGIYVNIIKKGYRHEDK